MAESKEVTVPFNLNLYGTGGYRVCTSTGFRVNLLTTESEDKEYRIKGYIGKSTQLESWTNTGKYYNKNKDYHYNDLMLIKNG